MYWEQRFQFAWSCLSLILFTENFLQSDGVFVYPDLFLSSSCIFLFPFCSYFQGLGSVSFQTFHQRTLSASSSVTAQLTCYAAAIVIAILGIPPVLVGAVAASTGGNYVRGDRSLIKLVTSWMGAIAVLWPNWQPFAIWKNSSSWLVALLSLCVPFIHYQELMWQMVLLETQLNSHSGGAKRSFDKISPISCLSVLLICCREPSAYLLTTRW